MPRYLFPALIDATRVALANVAAKISHAREVASSVGRGTERDLTPLEKNFPHILEKIQALWGYPEMDYYFARLTIDERGDRQGFPAEVWDDLQMLMRLHRDLFSY